MEREEFESWLMSSPSARLATIDHHKNHTDPRYKDCNGRYWDDRVDLMWLAWQAASKLKEARC